MIDNYELFDIRDYKWYTVFRKRVLPVDGQPSTIC